MAEWAQISFSISLTYSLNDLSSLMSRAEMPGKVVKEAEVEVEVRAQDHARVAMADLEVRVLMVAMVAMLAL